MVQIGKHFLGKTDEYGFCRRGKRQKHAVAFGNTSKSEWRRLGIEQSYFQLRRPCRFCFYGTWRNISFRIAVCVERTAGQYLRISQQPVVCVGSDCRHGVDNFSFPRPFQQGGKLLGKARRRPRFGQQNFRLLGMAGVRQGHCLRHSNVSTGPLVRKVQHK